MEAEIEFIRDEYVRFTLYKVYLYLIEVIECNYRQYLGEDGDKWARSQINQALKELEKNTLRRLSLVAR
ncbi:hypothetical protein [Clostridium sp. C2-6-12]|uniref:hypothetical protein n=1 Tax=Clostridium sp. C2-6-12 TaxID=2698832 RepID=UPI0019227F4E|nr:hypothetical protein [Clostridium sp. C2-6-12]